MKKQIKHLLYLTLILSSVISCSEVDVILPDENAFVNEIDYDTTGLNFHLDKGSIGTYFDVRKLYKKGFFPEEATITFPDYPKFNSTLNIDPWTTLAQFTVLIDSITEAEQIEFNNGIDTNLIILYDGNEIVSYQNNLVIDQNHSTIILDTDEVFIEPSLIIGENQPYLISVEGVEGLLRSSQGTDFSDIDEIVNVELQEYPGTYELPDDRKFYLINTGNNKYKIRFGESFLNSIYIEENENFNGGWFGLRENFGDNDSEDNLAYVVKNVNENDAVVFELVRDEEGWLKLKLVDSDLEVNNYYLDFNTSRNRIILHENLPGFRFRLLSDVNWEIEDLGVEYLAPIIGPVRLDFAFRSVLSNCSSAILTEEVGRTETRTSTSTVSLTEGIQVFSSTTVSAGVSMEVGAEAKVGSDVAGGSATGSVTHGFELGLEISTQVTLNHEETYTDEDEYSVEVSRIRTAELPPFTVVDIYDAIKSVDDVTIPFVIKWRISGEFVEDGRQLTGEEIVSQLQNNWFDGLITEINDNHILFSIRGTAIMDSLFESSSGAYEIPDGCNSTGD